MNTKKKILRLLHLVPDDKFTKSAQYYFNNASECENDWLVIKKGELSYLKHGAVIQKSLLDIWLGKINLSAFDFIIVHSLMPEHIRFINRNKYCKYVWIGMGYDYYDLLEGDLFLPFSQKYIDQKITKTLTSIDKLKHLIKRYLWHPIYEVSLKTKAISYIDLFSPVLESEFIRMNHKFTNLKYIDWNYGMSASIISKKMKVKDGGKNILVGNSCDPSNNHFETLKCLESFCDKDTKIYLPLSYGDSDYKIFLLKMISDLNLNINVLDKFIDKEAYFEILSDCNIVIMNHVRQQAGSNISVMLSMGAKVFLNKKSPFYDFYKNKGAIIYTIDELKEDPSLLNGHLSTQELDVNRKIITEELSESRIANKTNYFVGYLQEYLRRNVDESK